MELSLAHSGAPWIRKFGFLIIQEILILRTTSVRVRPPLNVSRGEILHFKYPRASAVNRIETWTFRYKKKKKTTTTTKLVLSFDLMSMSKLTWMTEKELERQIKTKRDQFRLKINVKIL